MAAVLNPVTDREAWLEARRHLITATDISAILGLHPYKSAREVYMEKKGLAKEVVPNQAMETGTHLEPAIASWFEKTTGKPCIETGLHIKDDIFGATPDRLIGDTELLECKYAGANASQNFGSGDDEVPAHYLLQVQWQLFVTGRKVGYLQVLSAKGFNDPYQFIADPDLHERMAFQARKFMGEYVNNDNPPPISGSYADTKALKEEFPTDNGSQIRASYEMEETIHQLEVLLAQESALGKDIQKCKNEIMAFMKDAQIMECDKGKFTWKTTKDRTMVNWEAVAREIATIAGKPVDEFLPAHTRVEPGYRRFTTPFRTERG